MTGHSTLPSALHAPVPGDVIAQKYQLQRCLGEGGQGSVWQAQNLVLELPVAIKLVHAQSLVPERLFREARAAATLGHPAIVRVFDIGRTPDGLPFLVMELLRGESLADTLACSGRLAPTHALRLLLPIADGLVAAHAERIIHRDVKPDNIFVATIGDLIQPKLLDFGLARRSVSGENLRRITDAGAILGTPAYLSPEQASGKGEVDERADVWSFCATLYECLSGVVPFQGTSWHELRRQIFEDEPTTLGNFGVEDATLWQLIRTGLAKSPTKRWSSMQALGAELARWLLERGVTSDICGVSLEARWLNSERVAPSRAASRAQPRPSMGARPSVRATARQRTRRVDKSTARPRTAARRIRQAPASTAAREQPAVLLSPSRNRRALFATAAALGCIALGVLMSAANRDRTDGSGIIAASRAAVLPTVASAAPAPSIEKPNAPGTPVVSPVPASSVEAQSSRTPATRTNAPKPTVTRHGSGAPVVVEDSSPLPAAPATHPAEPKAVRQEVEPLDLMEPY
ncbi:MAG TPA: protein kinase [Polyangiaceae bacterium]|nr:protein kinase [Polyangiaceae bacterium]